MIYDNDGTPELTLDNILLHRADKDKIVLWYGSHGATFKAIDIIMTKEFADIIWAESFYVSKIFASGNAINLTALITKTPRRILQAIEKAEYLEQAAAYNALADMFEEGLI